MRVVAADEDPDGHHPRLTLADGSLFAGAVAIPDVSAYCLECHRDGSGAAAAAAIHAAESAPGDHPVGIAYPLGDSEFRPATELDRAVLLLDGRLTCLTCHAYDEPRHGTVLPTAGSEICRACHLM